MKVVVLLVTALVLTGCGKDSAREAQASDRPAVPVSVVEVRLSALPAVYDATGTVTARTTAALSSKVMGYVREVRVQAGDSVLEGQLLMVLDSRDLDSSVKQAEAAGQEAESAILEADHGIAAAKVQLALARTTFQRMEDLFSKKSISNQEFDEARARLDAAQASVSMAEARRQQAQAKVAQARSGIDSASIMRSYSEIRSPFTGVVTEKTVDPGQLATPGVPLLRIEQLGSFRLEASVPESMLGAVRIGQNVRVTLEGFDRTVDARVTEIVPAVDPGSRAFIVKASLPSVPGLRSGSFGRMQVARGSRETLLAPENAISIRGELQTVFVVENGTARSRMVRILPARDGYVEVLSGLTDGDKVIAPRPAGLVDGTKVEIKP